MDGIVTAEQINEILQLIKDYFIYIYPGFITFVIYRFAMARNIDDSKNTIIKSIIISYIYVEILSWFTKMDPLDFGKCQHIILAVIAFVVPIVFNVVIKQEWIKVPLRWIGLDTEFYDNQMDILFRKENGSVWVRVYLDEQNIMYEGSLRNYESDLSKEQCVILSGYRMHVLDDKKELILKYDYENDHKQWVRILQSNITRMEFEYQKEHK